MKITGRQLKQLVDSRVKRALQLHAMNEADAPQNPALKPELGDSIDAQIDKKFIEYENESKHAKTEGIDYRAMAYRILYEAGEEGDDKEAGGGEDDLADDLAGGGDEGGGEETDTAAMLTLNDIDIYEFASSVARLIDNAENLLEFRDTIMKRSMNYLKKSYDATVLEQYTEVMDKQFDLVVGEDDVDKEFEITPPPAVGAGVPPGA